MPRSGVNGTYTPPPNTDNQQPLTPISSAMFNGFVQDVSQTFNTPTPVAYGGTGGATAIAAIDNLVTKGTDLPTSGTLNLNTVTGQFVDLTGNTTVTAVTLSEGRHRMTRAAGDFQITVGASLIGNGGGANIAIQTGDLIFWEGYSGGVVRFWVVKGNGQSVVPSATVMDSRPSLIVNGNFQMSQENGTTLGTANNFYFADQFFLSFTAATAAMSVQLLTSVRTLSGNDRVGEFKTTTAKASLGATDFVTLSTVIEGSRPEWKAAAFGTAGAKPFVYRLEFTGPAGLYHMHFQNSAGNRHCAVPFTVAAPEANVATVRTLVIPADTTGTWLFGDGDKGLVCDLVLAAGATLTGGTASTWGATAHLAATTQFNILSSTSNVARIADVGLKNDPDATGVYGLFNLMEQNPVYRSERYWEKSYGAGTAVGTVTYVGAYFLYQVSGTRPLVTPPFMFEKCKGGAAITIYNPFTGAAGSMRGLDNGADYGVTHDYAASSKSFEVRPSSGSPGATAFHWTANSRL